MRLYCSPMYVRLTCRCSFSIAFFACVEMFCFRAHTAKTHNFKSLLTHAICRSSSTNQAKYADFAFLKGGSHIIQWNSTTYFSSLLSLLFLLKWLLLNFNIMKFSNLFFSISTAISNKMIKTIFKQIFESTIQIPNIWTVMYDEKSNTLHDYTNNDNRNRATIRKLPDCFLLLLILSFTIHPFIVRDLILFDSITASKVLLVQ